MGGITLIACSLIWQQHFFKDVNIKTELSSSGDVVEIRICLLKCDIEHQSGGPIFCPGHVR